MDVHGVCGREQLVSLKLVQLAVESRHRPMGAIVEQRHSSIEAELDEGI